MLGLIQKILLTLIILFLVAFFGFGSYNFLIVEQFKFDAFLLIPTIGFLLSICSFIFHIKTIPLYRNTYNLNDQKSNWLWILNMAFGVAMIILAVIILYRLADLYDQGKYADYVNILIVFFVLLAIGFWTLMETRYLQKKLQNAKAKSVIDSIDDIRGTED